jgi:beta-lactam-binding protein with PASTA domain
MGFFYFLGQKKFYIHLLIAIILAFVLFWIALFSLDRFTRHGEVFLVPDFSGKTLDQLESENINDFFDLRVIDSVYDKNAEKGSIILQHPLPGSKVKQGRHIFLTIVSEMPETVMMPNLKNLSLRQALVTMESLDLVVGELEYVEYFARNAVVDQVIDEEPVEPGTEIRKGSVVKLLVGKGEMLITVPVPIVVALKKDEVKKALHQSYLNVGEEFYLDSEDTAHLRAYKTDPNPLGEETLNLGEKVDIWYRSDEFFDFENYLKQFKLDSLIMDTLIRQNIRK